MKQLLSLLMLLIIVSCSKSITAITPPPGDSPTDVPEIHQDLAKQFAMKTWKGQVEVIKDTFYFSFIENTFTIDSIEYRKQILDDKVVDAFHNVFLPAKDKPSTWKGLWFFFDATFIEDLNEPSVRFKYNIDQPSKYYFL